MMMVMVLGLPRSLGIWFRASKRAAPELSEVLHAGGGGGGFIKRHGARARG